MAIGVDLTNINRFQNKTKKFILKILHKDEINIYNSSDNKAKYLATIWAIKEALYKADNSLYNFSNINIIKKNGTYHYLNFDISTSTEDNYIIAVAKNNE